MSGRFGELLLILLVVFVLFGAGKLPKVMGDLGKGLRSFRKGIDEKVKDSNFGDEDMPNSENYNDNNVSSETPTQNRRKIFPFKGGSSE